MSAVADGFSKAEAEAELGRRYRATAGYAAVPAGSVGVVSAVSPAVGGGFGVEVTWEGVDGGRLVDGFSRAELLKVLREPPFVGRRAMVPSGGRDEEEGGPAGRSLTGGHPAPVVPSLCPGGEPGPGDCAR